ncbi:Ig-like domain-containing protein, partial [Streptomyces sp. NPDC002623]
MEKRLITLYKRRTGLVATAGVLGGVLAVTALGGTSSAATSGNSAGNDPKSQVRVNQADAQEASDARIKITPGQGAYNVAIDGPVGVTVSKGKLTKVTMTAVATGAEIPGTLSADGTSWKPNGRLERATKYQITAEAEDAKGRSATGNATITTVSPANDFIGHVSPTDGSTVGVGMPVRVDFDMAVSDKAAVESEIQVSSSSGQRVAGHWFNDRRLDFRPENYWKPGSTVTVTLNRHGIQKTVTFKIGRSQIRDRLAVGAVDRVHVVPVDPDGVPAEGLEAAGV